MSGIRSSPLNRFSKPGSAPPKVPNKAGSNPFDSDDESDKKPTVRSSARSSSQPPSHPPKSSMTNPFDDDDVDGREKERTSSTSNFNYSYAQRNKYKNDFRDSGGVDNQTVEELENYAVYRSEETTQTVNNCLKIAEGIREDATNTLVILHQQGEQISRTHEEAVNIDYDLSRGEKLLGSLGGLFSKTWKPKKTAAVKGPATVRGDPVWSKGNHLEQREKLGLKPVTNDRSKSRSPLPEPTNALQKVEGSLLLKIECGEVKYISRGKVGMAFKSFNNNSITQRLMDPYQWGQVEKAKQDDTLSDLSDLLGELKGMAVDMGSEIERQSKALDNLDDDVHILNGRVKDANQRTRRLLGRG